MAVSLSTQMEEIARKLDELEARFATLRSDKEMLENENAELHSENLRLQRELDKSRQDAEFLTMSHRLADSPDEVIKARRHVAKLIRDIDKCISQLKE